MLARLFKPNWQHAKPEKRIKAIAKFRATDAEAQPILSQLALEDQDELVRLSATEKLNNLTLLVKISKRDNSPNIQQQALHRISQIILSPECDTDIEEKLTALKSLSNADLLTHIALNSNNERLREQATSQIQDNTSLEVIAEKSLRASIRILATEKISCPETLERVQKASKNRDKGVFKVARDKLQQIREDEKRVAQEKQNVCDHLRSIQQLSQSELFPLYAAKLSALENEWLSLRSFADQEQLNQHESHLKNCQNMLAEQKAIEEAETLRAQQEKAQREKSHQIYSELCVLKEDSCELQPEQWAIDQLCEKLDSLSTQWEEVRQFSVESEQERFQKIAAQLSNLQIAYQHFIDDKDKLVAITTRLAQQDDLKQVQKSSNQARKLINRLSWPKQQTKPTELCACEDQLVLADQKLAQQQKNAERSQVELSQILDTLKQAISNGEIRSADKQIKKADQLSKRLNGQLTPELDQRIKSLTAELQEIRDWQAYAVTPKKESLCDEMEALSDSEIPVQEKANQIRRIQKEWKLLDSTDSVHSQQLWLRFKKASDKAYSPCDKFFAEQRDLRKQNLEHRQNICEKLAALTSPPEGDSEAWKCYEELIRQTKQDWRTYSPVDRAPGKKVQAEFDRLLKATEAPLRQIRQNNAKQKQALIERTVELLDSHNLAEATEQVKDLQKEWKALGAAPRNQERRLWNQFRENCSLIFERFYAEGDRSPQSNGDSNKQLLKQLQQAINELEELLECTINLPQIEAKYRHAVERFEAIEEIDASLHERLNLIRKQIECLKYELGGFDELNYTHLQAKAQICEQLEIQILENDSEFSLPVLQSEWEQLSQQTSADQPIDQRYATLLQLLNQPEALDQILNDQEQSLRKLCIRLEIATANPSPAEDQALRMEYQMERLQQALAEQKQGLNAKEIKQLEYEWLAIPFATHFDGLSERFENQLQSIL